MPNLSSLSRIQYANLASIIIFTITLGIEIFKLKQFQMFKRLLILLIGMVIFTNSLKKSDFGVEVSKNMYKNIW